jgi:heterogeneous nuclear ribonucleoprotein L
MVSTGFSIMLQASQVYIMDRPVFFNYSTSQEITRSPYGIVPGGTHDQMGGSVNAFGENHILLFTIFNPLYPITVDVIRTICSPYGFVQRIVIFRKNGLQVLVEYPLSLFLSTLSWNYAEWPF